MLVSSQRPALHAEAEAQKQYDEFLSDSSVDERPRRRRTSSISQARSKTRSNKREPNRRKAKRKRKSRRKKERSGKR